MEFKAADLAYLERYKLMTGAVAPRPIAWVGTVDAAGQYNLAPFSFFTAICPDPPLVVFCSNIRRQNGQEKDTLRNVRETGEFVINIVTEPLVEAMNISCTELPPEVDEFELAGLVPVPGVLVKAPRVGESPISLECKLHDIITIGDQRGQGSMVIGEIVYFHISDEVYVPDFKIDHARVRPVGRMAGITYARTTDLFDVHRPPSQIKSE